MSNDPLDVPALAPLWDELARRFGQGTTPVQVTLHDLGEDARSALADLLGLDRRPAPTCRLRIARVAAAVPGGDLRATITRLRGPIGDRRADRQRDRDGREALWRWLAEETRHLSLGWPTAEHHQRWLAAARQAGVPGGDVTAHLEGLAGVVGVLRALPADGPTLAGFATDLLGHPKALDPGRRAARLVLEAVALATGRDRPDDAEATRQLWEDVGVSPDPLSSTVLVLGLRSTGHDPLARWLGDAADAGEPVVLTLAHLRRWPVAALAVGARAYVVENPSLVAEAAAARRPGPPLVCSSGRPSVAVVTLLRQLGANGARLDQHADLDPTGLAITAWLVERAGTTPWRMTAEDYLAALPAGGAPLKGAVPPTPWDRALAGALMTHGIAVHEEDVRAGLLAEIGGG